MSDRFALGMPLSSLVGQISDDGPHSTTPGNPGSYFFIGSNYAATVTESGVLYLGFNDTDYGNNEGSVTATVAVITVQSVPIAATTPLLFAVSLSLMAYATLRWRHT
jgi:hypothetical protein